MKQSFILAALAVLFASQALADEVCIPVETSRVMDNGWHVTQVVCVSDDRSAPRLKLVDDKRGAEYLNYGVGGQTP